MPVPQISIEIAAPTSVRPAPRERSAPIGASVEREALLVACSAAAAPAECVVADAAKKPVILALVFWRGEGRARIEVGRASGNASWATRDLEFSPGDPGVERWRTAGYTVGSLAAEALAGAERATPENAAGAEAHEGATKSAEAASTASAATTPGATPSSSSTTASAPVAGAPAALPTAKAASSTPAPLLSASDASDHGTDARATRDALVTRARPFWLAGGATLGTGLDSVRAGGFLRVSRAFGRPYATTALAYEISPRDDRGIAGQWITLSAGAGYELPTPWFALDLRGELAAERLSASVDDPRSGRTDSEGRWVAAFRAGVELVRPLAGPLAVVAGVEGALRPNRTDVQVGNAVSTTASPASISLIAGLRLHLR